MVSEGWNFVKQLAAILGLYAASFVLLDATASPACLFAASVLSIAFGGFAFCGPCPVGSSDSCFKHVPMGAAMLRWLRLQLVCSWGPARWQLVARLVSRMRSTALLGCDCWACCAGTLVFFL